MVGQHLLEGDDLAIVEKARQILNTVKKDEWLREVRDHINNKS